MTGERLLVASCLLATAIALLYLALGGVEPYYGYSPAMHLK